jgi:hypothetical protein
MKAQLGTQGMNLDQALGTTMSIDSQISPFETVFFAFSYSFSERFFRPCLWMFLTTTTTTTMLRLHLDDHDEMAMLRRLAMMMLLRRRW